MSADSDQMSLWAPAHTRRTISSSIADPVARVLLDRPEAHLDHLFDYCVPEALDSAARPGRRCRVRLAGRLTDAWIIERASTTTHTGSLQPLSSVADTLEVLSPAMYRLCQTLASRYAGQTAQVINQAVPPRHAATEKRILEAPPPATLPTHTEPKDTVWAEWDQGEAFIRHLAAGHSPRCVWQAVPGVGERSPYAGLAQATQACLASGRSAILVAGTVACVDDIVDAVRAQLGASEPVIALHARLSKAARYEAFLRVLTGRARVVVGTRSAVFAPVTSLGLIAVWDDGADTLADERAPYIHARVSATTRAALERSGVILAGYQRTPSAQMLVESGWAHPLVPSRALLRASWPAIDVLEETDRARFGSAGRGRVPAIVTATLRRGLDTGPVLVQVPRAGYVPVVRCAGCGGAARCVACHGPLGSDRTGALTCGWCGRQAQASPCAECGRAQWRAGRIGSERTVEELGRAFPGVAVLSSGAQAGVIDSLDSQPRLVVATPGAEPRVEGGYSAAAVLDADVLLARPELWAPEEALRRWFHAAALVRPDGRFIVVGDIGSRLSQILIRRDGTTLAREILAERRDLGFPPAGKMIAVSGSEADVTDVLARLREDVTVLGPLGVGEDTVRALLRPQPGRDDETLADIRRVSAARSVSRLGRVRIQVDPPTL